MAGIVKGTIGNEPVELNNAATESTLAALLAIAKKDSSILSSMAQQAGVNAEAIKRAQKAMEQQNSAGADASKGLNAVAPKASLLGGFLMDMAASTTKTIGNLVSFGDELMEGKARASDLFKAFKDLPLGLGLVASIFQKVMQYQEKNLDTYRLLSDSGAGLNGSLNSLRTTASGMYLTLDELAEVTKKNSDVFRQLGGNAGAGAKIFQGISKDLAQSHLGTELLALGYSFTQTNDLIGSYIRVSGDSIRSGKNVAAEQERLAKATAQYGKDLDFLARITGESRDAAQKKFEEAQMETSWQAFLNNIADPKRKKNIEDALMRAQMTGDKGTIDLFKARMMGFSSAFSEEGQAVQSMFRGASEMVEGFVRIGNSNMSQQQAQMELDKLQARGTAATIEELKGYKNIVFATGQGAEGVNKQLMAMQDLANKYNQAGKRSEAQILQSIIDARKRQDADADAANAAVTNEKRMKDLGNLINQALLPVMEQLAKYGTEIVNAFAKFVKEVDMVKLGNDIKTGLQTVANYLQNLFTEEGRAKILNDIKSLFEEIGIAIRLKLDPLYWQSDAAKDRNRNLLNSNVIDAKANESKIAEQYNAQRRKMELLDTEQLQKNIDALEAARKAQEADTNITEEQRKERLAVIDKEISTNKDRLQQGQAILKDDKAVARMRQEMSDVEAKYAKARKDTADYQMRYNAWKLVDFEYDKGVKLQGEGSDRWDYNTGKKKFYDGTAGTGSLVQDFGRGTSADLHYKEAVLNEKQLKNLALGTAETGAAEAQKQLATAILSLNNTQNATNKLLAEVVTYTRLTADNSSRTKFARA